MIEVNDKNFEEIVLQSKKPVILDLWAPWCAPCKMISPILEELSQEKPEIVFAKCNVDDNPRITVQYNVRNIPTIMYFNEGKLMDIQVGAASKGVFTERLNKLYS